MWHKALLALFFISITASADFPKVRPTDAGLNLEVLEKIKADAAKHQTDSLVIIKNGKLAYEFHSRTPADTYDLKSATKSIVALAIIILISEGKIDSVDDPIAKYLREWKSDPTKSKITIRNLLGHTSGIQAGKLGGEIDTSPDFVKQALTAPLIDRPGERFFYNNKAVNLLPEIVKRASGSSIAVFLDRALFHPLGIKNVQWQRDQAGNIAGHGGLKMAALDLAKIGQALLNDGEWNGKKVIPKSWIATMTSPTSSLNPSCGLLWWLVPESQQSAWPSNLLKKYRASGFRKDLLATLEQLKGEPIDWRDPKSKSRLGNNETAIFEEIEDRHLEGLEQIAAPVVGYYANGWLGQILLVLPKQKLVVVRQSRNDAMPIIENSLRLVK